MLKQCHVNGATILKTLGLARSASSSPPLVARCTPGLAYMLREHLFMEYMENLNNLDYN